MSFRTRIGYTITAKPQIRECDLIERSLAELLLIDPYLYTHVVSSHEISLRDSDREKFIKLLFVADLRYEYGDKFFGGNAPVTVEFFDRWWTLIQCDDVTPVEEVIKHLSADDLASILSSVSEPMAHHVGQMVRDDRHRT